MKLSSLLGHTRELLALILQPPASRGHSFRQRPADSHIDAFFRTRRYLGSHDRRFIAESTYGTLRHLRRARALVDHAVESFPHRMLSDDELLLTTVAYLVGIERRGEMTADVIQPLLRSTLLKQHLPAILSTVASATLPVQANEAAQIGVEFSFPDWMVERFLNDFGREETVELCRSLNQQAPITLRVNTIKSSVEHCRKELVREGVETVRTTLSPYGLILPKRINVFSLKAFREGLFEVQDEGSQLLTLLLDPKPTAKVLDACAGAGGKSLALAAQMNNRGEIIATDVSGYRLSELRKRARRAGVSNIRVREVQSLAEMGDTWSNVFDLVLVDAPCSGLGTLRRNPGMKWSVTPQSVVELQAKQRAILEGAAKLVKPGGKLAYATCTLLREENEDVVEQFLETHAEYALLPPATPAGATFGEPIVSGRFLRLFPHRHATDGFFCAVLQRKAL